MNLPKQRLLTVCMGLLLSLQPLGPAVGQAPEREAMPVQSPEEVFPPDAQVTPLLEKPAPPLPEGPVPIPEQVPTEEETSDREDLVDPAVQIERENALQTLKEDDILPPDLEGSDIITRALLAELVVYAVGYNTRLVSEFPFYRDVPLTHPSYRPIEVAREKRLIDYPDEHGFYKPDQPALFSEVYTAIGNALTAPLPSEDIGAEIAAGFADGDLLASELTVPVAKMTNSLFFPVLPEARAQIHLRPTYPITALEIAPFIVRMMQITGSHPETVAQATAGTVAVLPTDLILTVTPVTSLFRSRLAVGSTVHFALVSDAGPLTKGSRFTGKVESVTDGYTYNIHLTEVRTVDEDERYETNARLTIVFEEDDKKAFIVPGQVFEIETDQPLPIRERGAETPSSEPPPVPPEASSGNTSAPNSDPRSSESSGSAAEEEPDSP